MPRTFRTRKRRGIEARARRLGAFIHVQRLGFHDGYVVVAQGGTFCRVCFNLDAVAAALDELTTERKVR